MKVQVESYYDGFAIIVDGERFHFDQEDSVEDLKKVLLKVNPWAIVTYEECY